MIPYAPRAPVTPDGPLPARLDPKAPPPSEIIEHPPWRDSGR